MNSNIKKNIFGIMVTSVVFVGFYVAFVLGQASVSKGKGSRLTKRPARTQKKQKKVSTTEKDSKFADDSAVIFYGEASPYDEVKVQSEESGKIANLKYKEGDQVKRNEAIVIFATNKLKLQLQKAISEKKTTQEQIREAHAHYQTCLTNNTRAKKLYKQGAISSKDFEASINAYDSAKITLRKVRETLEQKEITIKLLQQQLKDCRIVSPLDGIVNKKYYNIDEVYRAGDTIYHLVNINKIYVNARVSENYISRIRVGLKVRVIFSAFNKKYEGLVEQIPPSNSEDYNFVIKIVVANPDHKIKPGMFAKIILPSK